ncbi:MAG: GNAT family N-acetyltransferase [Candidatus Baldrarchaeia archaeon]
MSHEIVIRNYEEKDYEAVKKLMLELCEIASTKFNEEVFKLGLMARLKEDPKGLFVAEVGGKVIGTAFTRVIYERGGEPIGHISNVIVTKEWRGKGVEERLIESAINHLKSRGVKRIVANSRRGVLIHDVYLKFGFKEKYIVMELQVS